MSAARAIPADRPSGVLLRLADLARGKRPGSRRVTNVERVLAAIANGCSTETADLVAATGLSRGQVLVARNHAIGPVGTWGGRRPGPSRTGVTDRVRDAIKSGTPPRGADLARDLGIPPSVARAALTQTRRVRPRPVPRAPVVQSYFEAGFGERRDCARYEECLAGWTGAGLARCPRNCGHHETPDRTLESMHRAVSRPGTGGLP